MGCADIVSAAGDGMNQILTVLPMRTDIQIDRIIPVNGKCFSRDHDQSRNELAIMTDGSVRVLDIVSGFATRVHSLTDTQLDLIAAGQIRQAGFSLTYRSVGLTCPVPFLASEGGAESAMKLWRSTENTKYE